MLTRRLQVDDNEDWLFNPGNWQFDPSTVVDPVGSLLLSSYQRAVVHADMPSQNSSDPAWYISLRNVALSINPSPTYHLRCTLLSLPLLCPSMLLLQSHMPAWESLHCFRRTIPCIEYALVCLALSACVAGTWSRV